MTAITWCLNGCTRTTDGERIRVQTDPPSLICGRCEDNLRRWLLEIPDRFALLPTFIDRGSAGLDPNKPTHTKAAEAPAPMRLEIVDLLDGRLGRKWAGTEPTEDRRGVLGTLESWARMVREERGLDAPKDKATVTSEAAALSRHLLWCCEREWINELHDDLKALARELRDAVGDYRPKAVGVCPVITEEGDCKGPLFPTSVGGVRCVRCSNAWDVDDLARLGILLESDQASA